MFGYDKVSFEYPHYLWLLLLLPLLWYWSFRSLAGLGPFRRFFALLLRTLVMLLIILALASLQLLRSSETMTVIYLLDQSASIPQDERDAMVAYVEEAVKKHRDSSHDDCASVIVFGRDACIEIPPFDDDLRFINGLETSRSLRRDATNLEDAMKLAMATFPEGTARRLVIVSDGNQNLGDAETVARQLVNDGVGIDVVPIYLKAHREVAVERVTLPPNIRKGSPFDARVVVNNMTEPTENDEGSVTGILKLVRRIGGQQQVISESPVTLNPGKNVYRFQHVIDQPDFYEYQAIFNSAESRMDHLTQNNRATAFTHVRGQGRVLLIEDWENRIADGEGEFADLVRRLKNMNLEVTVMFSNELFTSLADLQRYDTVILANVPRSSGTNEENISNFNDAQVSMLAENTRNTGCGLVMIGGPNSFGAGGWSNTELEEAMPVDFQIRNAKIQAVGALAMVMHASEIAEGNHWQKVIAREALKTLGPQDYCGVIHWSGREQWMWGQPLGLSRVGPHRRRMLARISRMTPGDMPEFDPSMKMTAAAFAALGNKAAVKHMIIISDGDPSPPRLTTLNQFKKLGVQITTVAVGGHGPAASATLNRIATFTGGKYYKVNNPKALPRIYQKEARRVARPLIVDNQGPLTPKLTAQHEIMEGIDTMPATTGFVMTSIKSNPLVERILLSPYPIEEEHATILATWNYGLGRTAVLTTDAGKRWATQWTGWDQFDKFFNQLVRWSMRPTGDTGNFSVTTSLQDGKVKVVIDALDKDDNYLNFLDISSSIISPSMSSSDMQVRQTSPGRYIGEFEPDESGSFLVVVTPGGGQAPLRIGVNVPYSQEYRDRETNVGLLNRLAQMKPTGGNQGKVIEGSLFEEGLTSLLETNVFRRNLASAISSNYVWPWLVLISGCVFFGDVFVRRVAVNFDWVAPAMAAAKNAVLRREPEAGPDERLERLRNRKAIVESQIDQQRAAARFELAPEQEEHADTSVLDPSAPDASADRRAAGQSDDQVRPETEEEDYTSRLLKAKKQVWKKRDSDDRQTGDD